MTKEEAFKFLEWFTTWSKDERNFDISDESDTAIENTLIKALEVIRG